MFHLNDVPQILRHSGRISLLRVAWCNFFLNLLSLPLSNIEWQNIPCHWIAKQAMDNLSLSNFQSYPAVWEQQVLAAWSCCLSVDFWKRKFGTTNCAPHKVHWHAYLFGFHSYSSTTQYFVPYSIVVSGKQTIVTNIHCIWQINTCKWILWTIAPIFEDIFG